MTNFIKIASVLLLALLMHACIDDDIKDCRRIVGISLYSMSECDARPLYPDAVSDVRLLVFDADDILVAYTEVSPVMLGPDLVIDMEVGEGSHTVMAWSGLDGEVFDIARLVNGVTRSSDLLFRLRRDAQGNVPYHTGVVYFGRSDQFAVPPGRTAAPSVTVPVNMLEITNRIDITVDGLTGDADRFLIGIEADNGSMLPDGRIADDGYIFYQGQESYGPVQVVTRFNILALETSRNYFLVIRDLTNGEEIYRADLLADLILKNPLLDLGCDHDYDLQINVELTGGTYAISEVWVNNWLVHSYDKEM